MSAPRRPEPSRFELAMAERLGLDKEQILMGSFRVEWDSDGEALVRWTGVAAMPVDEVRRMIEESGEFVDRRARHTDDAATA